MNNSTYLTSIGITVKVDDITVESATSIGDLGGAPTMIDGTTLADRSRVSYIGVQEQDSWEIEYLFENKTTDSTFRKLDAMTADQTVSHTVEVAFPDGTKFTNHGTVSNRVNGAGVGEMIKCVLTVALGGAWTRTDPTSL